MKNIIRNCIERTIKRTKKKKQQQQRLRLQRSIMTKLIQKSRVTLEHDRVDYTSARSQIPLTGL